MVNTNIQGIVPIDGPGFVAKDKGNYLPGEYRVLQDVEVIDGVIKPRRSIAALGWMDEVDVTPMTNTHGIVGFIDEFAIITSATAHQAVAPSGVHNLWSPTSLTKNATAGSFHKIVGAFEYNKTNYWVTWEYNASSLTHYIYLAYGAPALYTGLGGQTYVSLTKKIAVTSVETDFMFCNFFIHKDRLWMITNRGAYFSKPTDPSTFTVPDGGFFRFPDQNINWAIALRDTILVLCDHSIFGIYYTTDPNEDGHTRIIADNLGADHGCVHHDTPYVVNAAGIYQVNSNNVTKVSGNYDYVPNAIHNRITSFENYLILVRSAPEEYTKIPSSAPTKFYDMGRVYDPDLILGSSKRNVVFINVETGSAHTLGFKDYREDEVYPGHVVEVAVNPHKDYYRRYNTFILTNKYDPVATTAHATHKQFRSNVYTMEREASVFVYDRAVGTDNKIHRYKPAIDIEIDSYTPDGNEYLMKKFRTLEMMGFFPHYGFEFNWAVDNENYPAEGIPLVNNQQEIGADGVPRGHYPARLGINQRGRSLTLRMKATTPNVMLTSEEYIYSQLEISGMRVLWTYTGRPNTTRTPTS